MNLSLRSFYPRGPKQSETELFKHKWFKDPLFKLENIFLIKRKSNNQLVGGLRTRPMRIFRNEVVFNCLGICEIFSAPDSRGLGLSTKLVKFCLAVAEYQEKDLILGVARRNIDGFYLKHDFFGIGSYPSVTVKNVILSKRYSKTEHQNISLLETGFHSSFISFYEQSYKKLFGSTVRNFSDFEFVFSTLNINQDRRCLSILDERGLINGYLIHQGNTVSELACNPDLSPVSLFLALAERLKCEDLTLNLSLEHPIFHSDFQMDTIFSSRECFYGGHIGRNR